MSFGPDMFNFVPGAQKTINGVTLRLTADADLQVVDSTEHILWHTNTNATCDGRCRAVLHSDGNLVVYGPTGELWSSGTWNVPNATVIFQPREAYLTIRDAGYEVAWTSNGDSATGATAVLNGRLTGPRAVPVQSFLDSLAVNTHMDQYERNAAEVYAKLNYIGVRTIRDHYSEDGSLYNNYMYLAQRGIRFNMLHYSNDFPVLMRDAETMASMPNRALIAVEGPNEINNFPFSCNGSTWERGWPNSNGPAAKCFMENYYSRVRSSARLSGIPVYQLTGGNSVEEPEKHGLLGLAGQADFGNIHPYPGPAEQPYGIFLRSLGSAYLSVLPTGAVITETGYATSEVSQRAQALYYVNIYLDAFIQGFNKTYIYELTDDPAEAFGFFDSANKPKESATALHNLTTILADSGTPREGALSYSLNGMPSEVHSFALQRSTGAFNIVMWDERPIWNGADVTPTGVDVDVDLGRNFSSVAVYRPLHGTAAVQQLSGVSSLNVQLAGEPVVLEVTP